MKRAAAQVGAASVVVAVVGYVAQFLAARWLGPADYASFALFWSVLFIVVGALSGIAQEVIRVARVAKLRADDGLPMDTDPGHPRIATIAMLVSAAGAAVVVVSGIAWAPGAFGADWPLALALLAAATCLVGGGLTAGGVAAGLARWRRYSALVALEGLARLIVFLAAALLWPTVAGFSVAAVAAFLPGVLVALLWRPLRRDAFAIRADAPTKVEVSRVLRAVVAAGLSGLLVVGWPAILSAAAAANPRGITADTLGVLLLLVTLTRAPIMVPLTTFQNALVARFTGLDLPGRRRWVLRGAGVVVLAGAVLAGLAALLGPPLLPILFGPLFQADAGIIAALTAASAGLGLITLTGVAAIAASRHTVYVVGWSIAIAVAMLVLFLAPIAFEWATVAALVVGPLSGAAVQLVVLRAPRASAAESIVGRRRPPAEGD